MLIIGIRTQTKPALFSNDAIKKDFIVYSQLILPYFDRGTWILRHNNTGLELDGSVSCYIYEYDVEQQVAEIVRLLKILPNACITIEKKEDEFSRTPSPNVANLEYKVTTSEAFEQIVKAYLVAFDTCKLSLTMGEMVEAEGGSVASVEPQKPVVPPILIDGEPATEQQIEGLNKSVRDLEFSHRVMYCLLNDNIDYLRETCDKTEAEMLRTPNFGRKSLKELKEVLASYDLRLRTYDDAEKRVTGLVEPNAA